MRQLLPGGSWRRPRKATQAGRFGLSRPLSFTRARYSGQDGRPSRASTGRERALRGAAAVLTRTGQRRAAEHAEETQSASLHGASAGAVTVRIRRGKLLASAGTVSVRRGALLANAGAVRIRRWKPLASAGTVSMRRGALLASAGTVRIRRWKPLAIVGTVRIRREEALACAGRLRARR